MESHALKLYEEHVSQGLKVHEGLVNECRNQLDIYLLKRELVGSSMIFYGDEKYHSVGKWENESIVVRMNSEPENYHRIEHIGGHTLAEILGKMLTINKTLDNLKPMKNEDEKQCSCSWACAPCKHRIPPITESIYDKYQI